MKLEAHAVCGWEDVTYQYAKYPVGCKMDLNEAKREFTEAGRMMGSLNAAMIDKWISHLLSYPNAAKALEADAAASNIEIKNITAPYLIGAMLLSKVGTEINYENLKSLLDSAGIKSNQTALEAVSKIKDSEYYYPMDYHLPFYVLQMARRSLDFDWLSKVGSSFGINVEKEKAERLLKVYSDIKQGTIKHVAFDNPASTEVANLVHSSLQARTSALLNMPSRILERSDVKASLDNGVVIYIAAASIPVIMGRKIVRTELAKSIESLDMKPDDNLLNLVMKLNMDDTNLMYVSAMTMFTCAGKRATPESLNKLMLAMGIASDVNLAGYFIIQYG